MRLVIIDVPRAAVTEADTLGSLLRQATERWPARPALEAQGRVWRYEEFDAAVDAAAGFLASRGLACGERIAVLMAHGAAHLAVPFIASRLGVSALLLSAALAPERWRMQLRTAQPRLVLTDRAHAARLEGCGVEVLVCDGDDPGLGACAGSELPTVEAHGSGSTLLYVGTSGTTGSPKLTCLTERGLLGAARSYLPRTTLEDGERTLVVMPLSYIGPITAQSVLMPLVGGCSVVADDPRPGPVADRLATDPITHLDAVPAWLGRLAQRLTQRPMAWRGVIYGGAPMPPTVATALAERVPGLGLFDVWGLSEVHGPVTLLRYDPADPPQPGVVGTAMPGLTVRAVGDEDSSAAGPGGVTRPMGELWVAGPTVTPGYLGDAQATAAVLRDGWLATGDLGTVDEDGTVRLLGRRKDVILRGSANVFSVEVEQVLMSDPDVLEVAVFAVPDQSAGEVVGAAVVPAEGDVDQARLRRMVRQRIGPQAVPRHVFVVEELPRNPTGKVNKHALAQALIPRRRQAQRGIEHNPA